MAKCVCPFWMGYLLASPLRRLIHSPHKILAPLVKSGMTVLEIGPAMGFFTIPLAGMVGDDGKVVCVDIQEKMLRALAKRVRRAKCANRIIARTCTPASLCLDDFGGKFDFALAFFVAHEIPDIPRFFAEISKALKPGSCCLIVEPKWHVPAADFSDTLAVAARNGFSVAIGPRIAGCRSALLCAGGA